MAAGQTYVPIATTTLGSAAASYTFSSIPSTYTDLILITFLRTDSGSVGSTDAKIVINSDTGTNYSRQTLTGNGTAASSAHASSETGAVVMSANGTASTGFSANIVHIQNYSNTTTYKTLLSRFASPNDITRATIGLWKNTSAITSLVVSNVTGNIATGSTLTLYGIASA